jgi:hypothetical protein
MKGTLLAAFATVSLSFSFIGFPTVVTVAPAFAQGSDVLVQGGLQLPRSHRYELYDRVNQSYTPVRVETVPSHVQQGAWIHDRTTGVWVAHPSVGEPNPQYVASGPGRDGPRDGRRDGRRGEELLGQRQVNFRADSDVIEVGRREGRFQKLRVVVRGAPIELRDMKVTFGDDSVFDASGKQILRENSAFVLDLPGDRRSIKSIAFQARSVNRREGKATVLVYGRH